VFTALVFTVNLLLGTIGDWTGLNAVILDSTAGRFEALSFQFIMAYALAPLAWLVGIDKDDILLVGQLLGEKTILNEFFAYISMQEMIADGSLKNEKSITMATYMLCGFANFASIGIQIGGIGSLSPSRKSELSKLGMRALVGGTLACLFTGTIAGMII
jgi:CNT family concentrative nucleoside transporter